MKKLLFFIAILVMGLGCNAPRNISDEELTQIVKEIFLTNATRSANLIPDSLSRDSLDIYAPIFERHGYTVMDMRHSIENLSRRKSIRFTDVLVEVIAMLEQEGQRYYDQLALLDSIDAIASRQFMQLIYQDNKQKHITHFSEDRDKPDITLALRAGDYEVSYIYWVDSLSKGGYMNYMHYVLQDDSTKRGYLYRTYTRRDKIQRETLRFSVEEGAQERLCILLNYKNNAKKGDRPSLWIDSLEVRYFLPRQVALDSLDASLGLYRNRYCEPVDSAALREMFASLRPFECEVQPLDSLDTLDTLDITTTLPERVVRRYVERPAAVQVRPFPDTLIYESSPAEHLIPLRLDTTGVVAPSDSLLR